MECSMKILLGIVLVLLACGRIATWKEEDDPFL